MSKESTLLDAIDHIQQLQKQVCDLHAELSKLPDAKLEKKGSTNSISGKFLEPESIAFKVTTNTTLINFNLENSF